MAENAVLYHISTWNVPKTDASVCRRVERSGGHTWWLYCSWLGKTYEKGLKKHEKNLRGLLLRCQDHHVTLGKNKVKLHVKEVTYLGHRFTSEGLKPNPGKVRAINHWDANSSQCRVSGCFIGMIKYLQKYLPKLSEVAKPQKDFVCKNAQFCWESGYEETVQRIKELVVSTPVLHYYYVHMYLHGRLKVTTKSDH